MKTLKHSTKQRVLQIAGALVLLTETITASPYAPPQITSPANGALITQPQVDIQVTVDAIAHLQSVKILANGTVIGSAAPVSFFGEWSFPDSTHISILEGMGGEVKIDYTPPDGAGMFLIDGDMTGVNTFSGSFIHRPSPGVTNTGDADATFTFSNYGLLTVAFDGRAPLGKRVLNGGLSSNRAYHFVWKNPPAGTKALTAVVVWLNDGIPMESVSTAVNVTVKVPKLPEIVIQQPKHTGLADGAGKRSFGTSQVGKAGIPKFFVIKNTGNAKLTGLSITKTGPSAKDFLIAGPAKSSLAAGESVTFKVTFKPTATGTRNAAIRIKSNDADENPFDIKLTGSGAAR